MFEYLGKQVSKLGRSEVQKVLDEATNSDNWNIANSKLQVLAEHSYDWYSRV